MERHLKTIYLIYKRHIRNGWVLAAKKEWLEDAKEHAWYLYQKYKVNIKIVKETHIQRINTIKIYKKGLEYEISEKWKGANAENKYCFLFDITNDFESLKALGVIPKELRGKTKQYFVELEKECERWNNG